MTFPQDLDDKQKITFLPCNAPDTFQKLTNFDAITWASGPVGELICLPLPANFEDSLEHTWSLSNALSPETAKRIGMDAARNIPGAGILVDSSGAHIDPNYFYAYVETRPRSFNYSVSLIPRNKSEASTILNIIHSFKKYSSPKKGGVFISNYVWKMNVSNSVLQRSTKFNKKIWALSNVTTNYTGAGSSLFFEDGNPKQINLTLAFQEISTMYSQDW